MSLNCLQGWQFHHPKPRLNNPTSLSCSSCILFSSPFTSFSALWARSSILLAVRGPKLSTVLELQSHQCRVQMHKHFPSPAGHAISDVGQDVTTLLGHLGTLMVPVNLAFNQHPQALFCWATLQALFPQAVPLHGAIVTQVWHPAFHLLYISQMRETDANNPAHLTPTNQKHLNSVYCNIELDQASHFIFRISFRIKAQSYPIKSISTSEIKHKYCGFLSHSR